MNFWGFCGFLDLSTNSTGNQTPGPPAWESDIIPLHYVHYGPLSEVKPGQTHLLLGWATTWDKTIILRFPAPGGPGGQNAKCKKVAQFFGENFWGGRFPPKSAPRSGKLCFSIFDPGLEFL